MLYKDRFAETSAKLEECLQAKPEVPNLKCGQCPGQSDGCNTNTNECVSADSTAIETMLFNESREFSFINGATVVFLSTAILTKRDLTGRTIDYSLGYDVDARLVAQVVQFGSTFMFINKKDNQPIRLGKYIYVGY